MAELTMSFFLMVTVLFATNHKRLAPYTAYFVGALIAMFYPVGAALSGMSTNPDRSFGPAVQADSWHALWIYFIAPSMGMLAAAETFFRIHQGVAPRNSISTRFSALMSVAITMLKTEFSAG